MIEATGVEYLYIAPCISSVYMWIYNDCKLVFAIYS